MRYSSVNNAARCCLKTSSRSGTTSCIHQWVCLKREREPERERERERKRELSALIKWLERNGVYSSNWRLTEKYLTWGTPADQRSGWGQSDQWNLSELLHKLHISGFTHYVFHLFLSKLRWIDESPLTSPPPPPGALDHPKCRPTTRMDIVCGEVLRNC